MITAVEYARGQSSYWSERLPRMEQFVRGLNLSVGRFAPPIASGVAGPRRAFLAELGFELFRQGLETGHRPDDPAGAIDQVRGSMGQRQMPPVSEVPAPSELELAEACALADCLLAFVQDRHPSHITVDPTIPGCGVIDQAQGDVLLSFPSLDALLDGETEATRASSLWLYEVKTVDRPFRATDVRQVLTYSTLLAADRRTPQVVGLVNPRLGTFFECTLDALTQDVAGLPAEELAQQIIVDMSALDVST